MLRRLEKRILVDLPSEPARRAMFQHHLPSIISQPTLSIPTEIDYQAVAKVSVCYSREFIQAHLQDRNRVYNLHSCFSLVSCSQPRPLFYHTPSDGKHSKATTDKLCDTGQLE